MTAVVTELISRNEAEHRRAEIIREVGDEARFKERGEAYELRDKELELYDDLCELDFLLGE
ncbi:hypothetical protein [Brevibacterium ihuae]|uniref:hypothetical protein n=1 Tax=Brevibacterium ihuae TaxID=1631743 RepID=UPI000C76E018|nr:hypothetical protein [Brevibacterium ihuae]